MLYHLSGSDLDVQVARWCIFRSQTSDIITDTMLHLMATSLVRKSPCSHCSRQKSRLDFVGRLVPSPRLLPTLFQSTSKLLWPLATNNVVMSLKNFRFLGFPTFQLFSSQFIQRFWALCQSSVKLVRKLPVVFPRRL
jgi:hypothetical protein